MVRYVIPTLLISTCLSATLVAQDNQRAVPPVPNTISREAQEFLRNSPPPHVVVPQSPEEWEAIRAEKQEMWTAGSMKVMEALGGTVEITRMGGVEVHIVPPRRLDPVNADTALGYVHGGGYCFGSPEATYGISAPVADRTGLRAYYIAYRLAPENPFPAGLDDCVAAYQEIITEVAPEKLGAFGESAGEGMVLAMVLKAQEKE